jgi:hypothetical protein
MAERLVATGRDTLAAGIWGHVGLDATQLAQALIDQGTVRVVDPADPVLVERVAVALAPAAFMDHRPGGNDLTPDQQRVRRDSWRTRARAAIGAVFSDQ